MMDRRNFIKLASTVGLTVVSSTHAASRVSAQTAARSEPYSGPFFVFVHASGGWDPTHLCDPKGASSLEDPNRLTNFLEADVENAGNIRYAPVGGNQAFFQKHYQRLLVINGIDTKTNGHDSGTRFTWSGRLAEGNPSLAALIAGYHNPALPMSFLSFGGFDMTEGLVARTRSGNIGALASLAFPSRRDPGNEESNFHSNRAMELIAQAQGDRQAALLGQQRLPRLRAAMNTMFTARQGSNELRLLQQYLPDNLDNSGNPLRRQAQVALAAYRAGISISASLSMGGFDTHGNHDASHIPRLQTLLEGVDFIYEESIRQGVQDRIVIVVGSDFGRTPGYNDQNGKDHWSVTSMMLMGPNIVGNRVVGESDAGHRPLTINPSTLQRDDGGIRIEPTHVHRSLRNLAGVGDGEMAAAYPLEGEDMPLLG